MEVKLAQRLIAVEVVSLAIRVFSVSVCEVGHAYGTSGQAA
jgi:hypothetical protein